MNTPQIHPLVRQGTHQRERLLQSLIPANLKLDDRTMADLLAFVGQLATHIRYWPDTNNLPEPEPNWEGFWQTDATPLLAILSATDLADLRNRYRSTELAYLRAEEDSATNTAKPDAPKPGDLIKTLVEQLFRAATLTAELYNKLPATHPLKAEFGRLISDKLRSPIRQVIAYHKGVATADVLADYQQAGFIDSTTTHTPWGITGTHEFRNAIKLQTPNNTDREPLWRLFLAFYNVLSAMVAQTSKSFQYALQSRTDHPPHVTLLLSFLYLFRHVQADFNTLPEKHLLFYYQDVLRLQQRGAISDRVHVVFEMAQNLERYRIQAGTLFRGGPDRLGHERLYALETETVISKAKLVEQRSLYFFRNSPPIPIVQHKNATGLSAKAAYNKLTGKITRLSSGQFSTQLEASLGKSANLSEAAEEQKKRWIAQQMTYEARPGLLICSPELWMDQSEGRAISVSLNGLSSGEQSSQPSLRITLSAQTELISTTQHGQFTFSEKNTKLFGESHGEFPQPLQLDQVAQLALTTAQVAIGDAELRIFLPPSFPALKPYTGQDEPMLARLIHPFILIQPENPQDYEAFSRLSLDSVALRTASHNLKNLTLQLGDVAYPANGDIPLVGATALEVTSFLYITTPEISQKQLRVTPNDLVSASLPISDTGVLRKPQILTDGIWQDLSATTPFNHPNYLPGTGLHYPEPTGTTFLRVQVVILAPKDNKSPINTYKISPESITLSYVSEAVPIGLTTTEKTHQLFHYHPFGGLSAVKSGASTLAPKYLIPIVDAPLLASSAAGPDEPETADGNLYLGFETLVPEQTLSVLFRMLEGSGDPDKTAPDIVWSYYRNNEPVQLPAAYLLSDETDGLSQTGVIRFQIPKDITTGNTAVPGQKGRLDLCWLMASATEIADEGVLIEALPLIDHIHAQAATLVFQDHKNTLEHLPAGLPANTISQLRLRDVNVRKVTQPYPSVEGRLPEGTDPMAYYRRISERLRHKQRAITVWDYERLVLEQFPKVDVVKCLPHTEQDDLMSPGYVTVAVIPNPGELTGLGRFYPAVSAGDRKRISHYLNQYNSFFVSGVGGFVACCCHNEETEPQRDNTGRPVEEQHPCGCPPESRLEVINARYEPVRLQVCIRFRRGKDPALYRKLLNDALREFLAPWTRTGGPPVTFGVTIKTTQLLRFLENLDYVDVVMSLKVKHFANKDNMLTDEPTMPWQEADELQPLTPRSVLTTYLNELDEENPNVVDHEINVLSAADPCHCSACVEEALVAWIKSNMNWTDGGKKLTNHLQDLVRRGELVADSKKTGRADGAGENFGNDAFWFHLNPDATTPESVAFALSTHLHTPFVKHTVKKSDKS